MSGSLATFRMQSALHTKGSLSRVKHLVGLWMRVLPIYNHCDRLVHHSRFCHASDKLHRPMFRHLDRNRHFGSETKREFRVFVSKMRWSKFKSLCTTRLGRKNKPR